jgi:hypothetical protein
MGLGLDLGTALSLGGSLLGGLGGGSKKKSTPIAVPTAFGQRPADEQKELNRQLADYFINAKYGDFFGRPYRRAGLGDIDGAFTPKAAFEIQNLLFDKQSGQAPSPQAAAPASNGMGNMKALELLREVQATTTGNSRKMKPLSQIDESALAALAAQMEGAQVNQGSQRGLVFGRDGKQIDLSRFY